jgi:nucleoside-diphosphate-sugar epimerase
MAVALKPAQAVARPRMDQPRDGEVLVLGGTGFIGRHLVTALARAGHPVRLLSRRAVSLSVDGATHQPAVYQGDVRDAGAIARVVPGCRAVIHLVSGAPASWAEYERLFVEGTRNVAEACLRSGVPQLLFVSSIAAYYLGRRRATITEDTPLDDCPRRSEYTRAKVACERLLLELHRTRGLPVTIFRPGVVVGAGGPAEHLGAGFWPAPTHCVSWGRATRSPLPFVLAGDVAAALAQAVGRPGLAGLSFNLVGDVGLSVEEYVAALREASGRDIRLHRQSILKWYLIDLAKWAVKAVARKPENVFPSYRDLASRALRSPFDCGRAKRVLDWHPVADRERFIELGVRQALGGGEGK